ncbi:Cyclin-B1-2 [Vitis vinifera]|uniref:Cyclin-B1-2 n=1 Tax=Vitis vinifera TaxID=29760 RepID=A0A438JC25_VITVI|nr:Cyclin-B1-2 [Vitis vinifera]
MKRMCASGVDCDLFQRPPGAIPSSMLGLEALTGSLDNFGFEDYLNGFVLLAYPKKDGRLQKLGIIVLELMFYDSAFHMIPYPCDSEAFRPADMHHGMEVRLGISKGPICPSFI